MTLDLPSGSHLSVQEGRYLKKGLYISKDYNFVNDTGKVN